MSDVNIIIERICIAHDEGKKYKNMLVIPHYDQMMREVILQYTDGTRESVFIDYDYQDGYFTFLKQYHQAQLFANSLP